jgi:Rrf2 family protein
MIELALRFDKGPVLLKDISNSQEISLKYLSQLIIPLKIAGLIKSTRGAHGGYFLAKPPSQIKILQIIEAVEGPTSIVECVKEPEICKKSEKCFTRKLWSEVNSGIVKKLEEYTLEELVDRESDL